jgi:hypothetical protein
MLQSSFSAIAFNSVHSVRTGSLGSLIRGGSRFSVDDKFGKMCNRLCLTGISKFVSVFYCVQI